MELEDSQWTTVKRRCARSLNSLERNRQVNKEFGHGNPALTREQVQVVQATTNELTDAQKQNYQRQHQVITWRSSSSSSRGEGPSKPKGKGIDLQEWGMSI